MTDRCTGNTLLGATQQPRRMPAPARADARHAAAIDAAAVFRHAATAMVVTGDRMRILAANPANAEFERCLAHARRHAQRLAVLFIDLDHFKWVNDTLGHSAGDVVLREVACRLRSTVRAEDLVARWGGDEFIVVLDDPVDATAITGAARLLQSAIARGIDTLGHRLRLSASIGVAMFPDDAASPVELLRASDAAMDHAKQQGGARVVLVQRP